LKHYLTQHHDPASLLAGKLHAILQRAYAKGQDVFDLMGYLSDPRWPAPNLAMLNNALQQSGLPGAPLTESTWRAAVRDRLQALDWRQVTRDVQPFLEPEADPALLTRENVMRVLEAHGSHP
jgi:hypothetical protein